MWLEQHTHQKKTTIKTSQHKRTIQMTRGNILGAGTVKGSAEVLILELL